MCRGRGWFIIITMNQRHHCQAKQENQHSCHEGLGVSNTVRRCPQTVVFMRTLLEGFWSVSTRKREFSISKVAEWHARFLLLPLLVMRFLPTDSHFDLHQASTAQSYSVTTQRHGPHAEPFALLTPLSPPPPPLLLCLPLSGQRQQPQTEHSGGPLGDPSARVFEVFLIVLNGVPGKTLWGGESRF